MDKLENNVFNTALIFEGGGMRASYTSAVANVLLENDIYFDNVYGLSAGSSNAVNYVSRDKERTKRSFVDFVTDPEFGGLSTWLEGKGYFSAEYIYEKSGLPGGRLEFDFDTFRANPAKVTIETFDRDTGESVFITKDQLDDPSMLMRYVRASSTLPFFMPSPEIAGHHFYDGGLGVGAGLMLPRAERDGFTRFLIVRTRPRGYRKQAPDKALDRLLRVHYHRYGKLVQALEDRWKRYNLIADEIDRLEQSGHAYVFYADKMGVESGETDLKKLEANYRAGYMQACDELPAIVRFLERG